MQYTFTVFTPSYNRAHTLYRVYESLKYQTYKDFEWLIVDDGSTDNTQTLIIKWQKEADFPIRYFYQENQHKKVAFNKGVREARGEFFLNADSDDSFMANALERFYWHWQNIPEDLRKYYAGIASLCIDEKSNIVGKPFPGESYVDSDYLEMIHRYKLKAERWMLFRTEILKQHPFPEEVEGCIPEGIVWGKIAEKYKLRFINETLRKYYTGVDQLSFQINVYKNLNGLFLYCDNMLEHEINWFKFNPLYFLRAAINWIRFGFQAGRINKNSICSKKSFVIFLLALAFPIGVLLIIKDLWYRK